MAEMKREIEAKIKRERITMQMEARRLSHSPEKVKHVFFILDIFILFQNLFSDSIPSR